MDIVKQGMDIDKVSKWTTTASAYAVAGAALYTAGYFQVVGRPWMPMITTSEMIAFFVASSQNLILLTVGTFFCLFVIGALQRVFSIRDWLGSKVRAIITFFCVVCTFGGLMILRFDAIGVDYNISFSFNYVMIVICVFISVSYTLLKDYSAGVPGDMLFVFSMVLMSCNISGMYSETRVMNDNYVSDIHLSDGRVICRKLIFTGSRGLIISGNTPMSREFIKYENYSRIYQGGKCSKRSDSPSSPARRPTSVNSR